jgi:DNA-binding NtrC family response regulator
VIVAEDNDQMRAVVAETLRSDGYDVAELRDGAELLVRIARQYRTCEPLEPIDLIVADVRMPVVTGLAILKGLRDAHFATPVILMTAFGDANTRSEAERFGAVFFDKPFKMAALRGTVRRLLDARAASASSP